MFWQKPVFWIVCFIVLLVSIPLVSVYLSKRSSLPFLEPTNIALSPTPTTAKPGSCLILEEKYCDLAKLIDRQTPTGQESKMIGLRLPPGVPIFLPSDGQVPKIKLNNDIVFFKGYQAIVFNPSDPNTSRYKFSGDLKFDNMFSSNLKQGDIVGYTQDTGIDMLGYNLVFYAYGIGPDRKEIINEDVMKQLFPTIEQ